MVKKFSKQGLTSLSGSCILPTNRVGYSVFQERRSPNVNSKPQFHVYVYDALLVRDGNRVLLLSCGRPEHANVYLSTKLPNDDEKEREGRLLFFISKQTSTS